MDTVLNSILSLKRPTFTNQTSIAQESWSTEIKRLLPDSTIEMRDKYGNLMAYVYQQSHSFNPVLYVCHLDTVHRSTGAQLLSLQGTLLKSLDGECLGADDGAGVWLMLSMIEQQIPGAYLFHFAEEVGCYGSQWMYRNHADWLSRFETAISFDRPYCSDVVTHLCGRRACDDYFAFELADALSGHLPSEYLLSPSATGGMTDVFHYIGLIRRCTNISVGYTRQHSPAETLDLKYLMGLRDACLSVFSRNEFLLDFEHETSSFDY